MLTCILPCQVHRFRFSPASKPSLEEFYNEALVGMQQPALKISIEGRDWCLTASQNLVGKRYVVSLRVNYDVSLL